jgi:predicted nucleotidyltransferase
MFGSFAKGKEKNYSDLDLCVVSPAFGKDTHKELVNLMILAGKVDDMIEPHPYHPKDLKDKWDPLAYQIKKTGKVFNF